jgi:hypothetical protein
MSIDVLIHQQNADGGWPYHCGKSWTEPTVYAVMALLAAGESRAAGSGLNWLAAAQRPDGGWAPQPGVEESTWVTGLVALLPVELLGRARHAAAIGWLMGTVGRESTLAYRVREFLLGHSIPPEQEFVGWPWVPGAAAWVGPTSVAILALDKERRRNPSGRMVERIDAGRNFLLQRMCGGGGWNHGSARPLGYDSDPYPETTGMALAALRGVQSPKVDRSLEIARRFLAQCRSADAFNWLRLGLLAHGQLSPESRPAADLARRTTCERSIDLLLQHTDGSGVFWV